MATGKSCCAKPTRTLSCALAAAVLLCVSASCRSTRPSLPAAPIYDLALPRTDGTPFELASLKGKVALITFFATWCLPCLLDVPVLQELQARLGASGLQVVAVGMDLEGARVLAPFVRANAVSYPVLVADQRIREGRSPFGPVTAIPETFVLDREGQMVEAYSGSADRRRLESLFSKLLKQGAPRKRD